MKFQHIAKTSLGFDNYITKKKLKTKKTEIFSYNIHLKHLHAFSEPKLPFDLREFYESRIIFPSIWKLL